MQVEEPTYCKVCELELETDADKASGKCLSCKIIDMWG